MGSVAFCKLLWLPYVKQLRLRSCQLRLNCLGQPLVPISYRQRVLAVSGLSHFAPRFVRVLFVKSLLGRLVEYRIRRLLSMVGIMLSLELLGRLAQGCIPSSFLEEFLSLLLVLLISTLYQRSVLFLDVLLFTPNCVLPSSLALRTLGRCDLVFATSPDKLVLGTEGPGRCYWSC